MFSLLLFITFSYKEPRGFHPLKSDYPDAELREFDQIIDHDSENSTLFKQRYYYVNKSYVSGGPVILEIGGESDNFKPSGINDDFVSVLAKDLGALVLTLEHRFFGKSFPTEDTKTESLKLLTVHQALEDLRYFQEKYSTIDPNVGNVKWLIVGGSYPGALSAIARQEYPNNFHAAISSSGVVLASDDYQDFDLQDAVSMGQECASVARHTRYLIDSLLDESAEMNNYVKKQFNAENLSDFNFRFVVGEIFTLALQYGHVGQVCGPLVDTLRTGADPIVALAKFTRNYFIPKFASDGLEKEYSDETIIKMETSIENVGSRCWLWMTCNELAYWQTSSGRLSLRSPKLNKAAFQDQCTRVFGEGISPKVEEFNQKYHGLKNTATRVFYTTGSQDPWTWTCITAESGVKEGSIAHTITGPDMGHCTDLHAASASDPPDLVRTREYMRNIINKWSNC